MYESLEQNEFNDRHLVVEKMLNENINYLKSKRMGHRITEGGNVKFKDKDGNQVEVTKINRENVQPTIDSVLVTVCRWFECKDQEKMKNILFTTGSTPDYGKPGKKDKSGDVDFTFDNDGLTKLIKDKNLNIDIFDQDTSEISDKKLYAFIKQKADEDGLPNETIAQEIHVCWPIQNKGEGERD